ncbi:MAG TPA: type II secretion system protein [Gaiellaceae bacterium]
MTAMRDERGFGLVELLIAMVVLQVALLAIVGAFSTSAVAVSRSGHVSTAGVLADQQMELYRSMPYDAIGLDTAGAPTTGTYVSDTGVCPSGQSPVCANTGPRNNLNTATWSCTATSGSTSVSAFYSSNGVNPCTAHRVVSGASSPDGHTYAVDTYIRWMTQGTAITQRAQKIVYVVVRDGSTAKELAKEVTTFDCSTGNPPNQPACT